jgi:hypothetical protein
MEYGHEGSLLIEEWEANPQYAEDYPPHVRGPRAYVELAIDSPYGYEDERNGSTNTMARGTG